jgi:hypothetical protein
LGYAVHVYKAQGITAEASGILTCGWQTDGEHAYVALSRAREQTQVYVSREEGRRAERERPMRIERGIDVTFNSELIIGSCAGSMSPR